MVLWLCLSTWMGTGTGSRGGFLGQSCSRRLSEHLQGRPEKLAGSVAELSLLLGRGNVLSVSTQSVGFLPLLVVSGLAFTPDKNLIAQPFFSLWFFHSLSLRKSNTLLKHVNNCHCSAVC